jgi:hypothetical protein
VIPPPQLAALEHEATDVMFVTVQVDEGSVGLVELMMLPKPSAATQSEADGHETASIAGADEYPGSICSGADQDSRPAARAADGTSSTTLNAEARITRCTRVSQPALGMNRTGRCCRPNAEAATAAAP